MEETEMQKDEMKEILSISSTVKNYLQKQPTDITKDQALKRLHEIAQRDYDWESGGDIGLGKALGDLGDSLSRLRMAQRNGSRSLSEPLRSQVNGVLDRLKKVGIHLVPNGSLESWVPDLTSDLDRNDKPLWATLAAQRIQSQENRTDDVWRFISEVDSYIADEIRADVHPTPTSS